MTLTLESILLLVWVHLLGDFILQTDKMAQNKSKSDYWLWKHVLVYSACFVLFGLVFALVNALLHFVTDYVSSRITSYLWKRERRHAFFVVIGIDQAVHLSCLFVTYAFCNQWNLQ